MIKIDIDIEEAVKLKEQGLSDSKIAAYLNEKGIKVTYGTINKRLNEYYKKIGKKRPKVKQNKKKTEKYMKEIVELKEQGKSDKEIVEYLKEKGVRVSCLTINNCLKEYYNNQEKIKLKPEEATFETKIIKYRNPIEEILMSGMTIEEFIAKHGKEKNEEKIRKYFANIRIIAKYSEKKNGKFVSDNNFIDVIDILDSVEDHTEEYRMMLSDYIVNGNFSKEKIDVIKKEIFANNTDLMIYMLTRLGTDFLGSSDKKEFNIYKEQYKAKINKYLKRYKIMKNQIMQKNKNNAKDHEER